MSEPTGAAASEFNRLYQLGWNLGRGELLLGAGPRRPGVGWWTRRKLNKAVVAFKAAIAIHPASWQSYWALGKIQQRLEDYAGALASFDQAHAFNPVQVDVLREAGIAAADAGQFARATGYVRAALALAPAEAGLHSNLALVLLLDGQGQAALESVHAARLLAPDDKVASVVESRIQDVIAGRRPAPRAIGDLLT